ncbi:diguanylate cyclase [Alteromonas hispanica]|uniref:Diguanylate cyclase n=1 Tax=Alteromonas hispanica TaxID=315421 RepID=A0A6L9MRJ3_9ALTE|nr:diguanylate cyclase [Alteromonas hispanica]NDW20766.1 diguanylate cyclase [Alteromonas hispanica]
MKVRRQTFCLLLSYLLSAFLFSVNAQTIVVPKVQGEKEQILYDILALALSKSAPSISLSTLPEVLNEAQLVSEVESESVDVMWSGGDKEKDDRLQAVRIPVLKGLLGHRIFLIREQDKARFATIQTFEDLLEFEAGQGRFWGDTQILKSADIPTVTTIKYKNLFPMLEGGRFDYFPRALHEPFIEAENHKDLDLVVDSNVMLVYPYAMYFYVNKNDKRLHNLIYRGFEMAIEDGSYDELFFSNSMIQDVLTKANIAQRTVFRVGNPHLHPDTPLNRDEFWLDIENLK